MEQASELLHVKLWGIGSKAPNRTALAPGDRVLIYVGAPESEFIGHVVLASGVHQWTSEEAARYPGDMSEGVAFAETELWPHPVSIRTAMPGLDLERTNPQALFFSGVTRITQSDYEAIVSTSPFELSDRRAREIRAGRSTPTCRGCRCGVDMREPGSRERRWVERLDARTRERALAAVSMLA